MQDVLIRTRHEIRRRNLRLAEKIQLTPQMLRLRFEGPDLADFVSLGADDHVKLVFPTPEGEEMRDYTPRAYDAGQLTVDFALHDQGVATDWARRAQLGDGLTVAGPRGSATVADGFDWHWLIGDETALPAIARWRESETRARVQTLVAVTDAAEEQWAGDWLHRPAAQAADPQVFLDALKGRSLPEGRGFVFIAAEAQVARALRGHFLALGQPLAWMKAAGYWVAGQANSSDKTLA